VAGGQSVRPRSIVPGYAGETIHHRLWYFLILNCFKIPFFLHREMITTGTLTADLVLLPAIAAGAFTGVFLLKRIPQTGFVMIVRVLTLLAGVKLLVF